MHLMAQDLLGQRVLEAEVVEDLVLTQVLTHPEVLVVLV